MDTHSALFAFDEISPSPGLCFTREQMRAVDAFAIEKLTIPGLLLMEHAAIALRDHARRVARADAPVTVLIGPGNNGGDGSALARLLHVADGERRIRVVVLAEPQEHSDAGINLRSLRALSEDAGDRLLIETELPDAAPRESLIFDAMFGSGLSRPLKGVFAQAVDWISEQRRRGCTVLAVDVPSGLDCDTGAPLRSDAGGKSPAVRADHTLTLGGIKRGMLEPGCTAWTGPVRVGDIGVPRRVLERFGEPLPDQG